MKVGVRPAARGAAAGVVNDARMARPDEVRGIGRGELILTVVVQFAIAAAAFRVMGLYRLMDADEGHFLSAIQQVYEGRVPHQDFFYQQTPLFPYAYAAAMWVFGYGYETCMWLSVACGAGLAVLMGRYFARHGGGRWMGWIGWLLIVLNAQVFFWVPTVKNHAMPLFFGVLGLYAVSRRCETKRAAFWWGVVAGFGGMWSVGTRLPALPLSVAAGVWMLARAFWPGRPKSAWAGVLGFAVGMLPGAVLVLRCAYPDPYCLFFDVVKFHEIRSGAGRTFGTWETTMKPEVEQMLAQHQFPAMVVCAMLGAGLGIGAWLKRRREGTAAVDVGGGGPAVWLMLGGFGAVAVTLLPTQTFHQYFMVPLMFFLLASVPIWSAMLRRMRAGGVVLAGVIIAAYGFTPCNVSEFFNKYKPGVELFNHRERVYPEFPESWSHENVRFLSEALAAATGPNDLVFTTWQGFDFFARRKEVPGNENFNARTIAYQLRDEELKRLHVATNAELAAVVSAGQPKAIVVGFFAKPFYNASLFAQSNAVAARYTKVKQVGGHALFVRNR